MSSSQPAAADYISRVTSRDLTALGYRRIVILLVALVVVPTFLLLAVGVVLLVLGEVSDIVMGILVLALSGTTATGVILVWVFVRRESHLSQLQSDFVSKVSHELRTPLTSIRLFTETLELRRGDRASEDTCIEGLTRESQRLQELIDRLLDWGRMESGRRVYTMATTEVAGVLEAAATAVSRSLKTGAGGNLTIDVDDGLPEFTVDRAAIVDALVNLLTNAHKYGGDPLQVVLSARRDDDTICISVEDNGPGIPRAEHKRIFQKFYRVDDRLSRAREGSGLGLSIVSHIVHAHGGKVVLESAPGEGSTFTLALPIRQKSA